MTQKNNEMEKWQKWTLLRYGNFAHSRWQRFKVHMWCAKTDVQVLIRGHALSLRLLLSSTYICHYLGYDNQSNCRFMTSIIMALLCKPIEMFAIFLLLSLEVKVAYPYLPLQSGCRSAPGYNWNRRFQLSRAFLRPKILLRAEFAFVSVLCSFRFRLGLNDKGYIERLHKVIFHH